jgi:hypothetical protein
MGDPSIRNALHPARFLFLLSAGWLMLAGQAAAKVFLDTSARDAADSAKASPARTPDPVPAPARPASAAPDAPSEGPGPPPAPASVPVASPSPRSGPVPGKPHYATALFLSADNMLVYSHLGVLKALEEFQLKVDIVVAESKSLAVAAAWALRYPMVRTEAAFLERPLSGYLRPHREHGSPVSRYTPFGPDPLQVEIPLGLQSLQAAELNWTDAPTREGDEYLHLAWMVAKLTHDAPGGPVEDLREAPRPLAVQVTDLQEERGKVLVEGNLQSLLKAGLLPQDAVHRRRRLWPYAPGSLVSGNALMADRLPFTFDRLILVEPGRRLRPPSLEAGAEPWQDSLGRRLKARPYEGPGWGGARVLRIELNPDPSFENGSGDPKAWVDLGYTSALRSMDVLLSSLGRGGTSAAPAGAAGPAGDSARTGGSGGDLPPPLGLNRFTVNPLASGGRQLLQDLVRKSVAEWEDSTGDGPISDLVHSGYYGDLDVEWVKSPAGEYPALVFDALEKSRLLFQAGANVANQGEDLPDRGPEMLAGLAWNEPFYVPFRAEGTVLLGGHRPGFALRGMIAPIHPVHLELGIGWKRWSIRYPEATGFAPDLDPLAFRLSRRRTQVFLDIYPAPWLALGTAIQKHEMELPAIAVDPDEQDPGAGEFESTDFQQTVKLAPADRAPSGIPRHYLWLRYRNQNRVNLFGPVKYSLSSVEARLRVTVGDFRLLDQYYWSNQDRTDAGLFELMEAGEVSAWSYQDEFFLAGLRSPHFQNVQAEYSPAFGRAGIRLMAGGFRLYGRPLTEGYPEDFTRLYWEAQASYATPAGPLRAGLGCLEGDAPTYFIRFGADLDLERDGPED